MKLSDFELDAPECEDSPYGIYASNKGAMVRRNNIPCRSVRDGKLEKSFKLEWSIKFKGHLGGWTNVFRFTRGT